MDKRVNGAAKGHIHGSARRAGTYGAALRQEQLQALVECVSDVIMRIGMDGRLHYVSPSCFPLLGVKPEWLFNGSLYEQVHSGDIEKIGRLLAVSAETGQVATAEFRMRHASGNTVWVEMRSKRADYGGSSEIVGVLRDISERHREHVAEEERHRRQEEEAQAYSWQLETSVDLLKKQIEEHKRDKEALALSEMRYTALVENTLTGIYIHDGRKLVFCNERFAQIFGIDRDNVQSLNTDEFFSEERSVEALLSSKPQEELVEGKDSEGNRIWLKMSRARMVHNGQSLVVGNVIDVTDHIATHERLRESERELHTLSAQLMAAQEQERKRIANELHDGLGQRLSAIKFAVENVLRSVDHAHFPEQSQRLTTVIESIRDSIEEVRRVSMDLRPSILDDLGLIATINWFCREFSQLFPAIGVHRTLSACEADIPQEVKVVIFRIIQEAFHNIAKHAQADQVELDLSLRDRQLRLMIRDNGRGVSCLDSSPCAKGLGLKSMRERAELSKGEFRIDSVAGKGTVISVQWRQPSL